jgi:hypothetical protein
MNLSIKEQFVMQPCVEPSAAPESSQADTELRKAIARRARELWEQRGRVDGHAEEDWLQAEAEVLQSQKHAASPKTSFIMVKFAGSLYTAAYDPEHCDGYRPGELRKGAPVAIRLTADRLYLKRPNGQELEARILKKQPAAEAS